MCGVFGIASNNPVVSRAIYGIYDLQQRGEQGAGISVSNGKEITTHKDFGLVSEVFSSNRSLDLQGNLAVGHTLYSTIGRQGEPKQDKSIQPHIGYFNNDDFALVFNGNLVELDDLREEARKKGFKFQSEVSDTEVIVGLLSTSDENDFINALLKVLPRLKGAFALVILYRDKVIGVRDSKGIRPLCLGRDDGIFMLASESCAFYTEGGDFIRDINPGEIIILSPKGIESSFQWADDYGLNICMVEYLYFARPDSIIDGCMVNDYRYGAGEILAEEHPVEVDMVCSVPDSGKIYNNGFANKLKLPVREAIFRNRYITTRTFLAAREKDKRSLQRRKLHVLPIVNGKTICITEDSIFRANVSPEVVLMCRKKKAKEVHLRVGSAPIRFSCHLGIDVPTRKELVASDSSVEQIQEKIGCDSLGYLSEKGMVKATGLRRENICLGCFNGKYPVKCKKTCIY